MQKEQSEVGDSPFGRLVRLGRELLIIIIVIKFVYSWLEE